MQQQQQQQRTFERIFKQILSFFFKTEAKNLMDLQPKYTFQRPDRLKTVVENDMVLYETESGFGELVDKHKLRV